MSQELDELRDLLISQARNGEITPAQAEDQARIAGLPPFEAQPTHDEFNPMAQSRWSLVMAIAWIAWRDAQLVMEQGAEFRSLATCWVPHEWRHPTEDGTRFVKRAGWFLEPWHGVTAVGLTRRDVDLRVRKLIPSTARWTPSQAERQLWESLSDERLIAEGFDKHGQLVEIPAREWAHLGLFEERKQDVLKYGALDREPAYTKLRFRKVDLVNLWPRHVAVDTDTLDLGFIAQANLAPMTAGASHVPLCVALCWVITKCGINNVRVRDDEAWEAGANQLMPRISDGSIEIIGRDANQMNQILQATAFASIRVPPPLIRSIADILAESGTHVRCNFFTGEMDWQSGANDQFVTGGSSFPRWTHLQVRRRDVLKIWPKPEPKSRSEVSCRQWLVGVMRESPHARTKPKPQFMREALIRFKPLSARQFGKAWEAAIEEAPAKQWAKAGRTKKELNHSAD